MDDLTLQMMKLHAKGYCCAQVILILALEAQGKINEDLVRSVGGLCFGINWSGEVCGALSGGACLISLYAGKGSDEEVPDSQCLSMVGELIEWFTIAADDEYGGTRCHEILEKYPDRSVCSLIVADTYKKCMEILVAHGFDPSVNKKS
ncbi:MAG: DVU_1555 family C-GCAxxG-C-C protein [Syntrophorhabdus sp.]